MLSRTLSAYFHVVRLHAGPQRGVHHSRMESCCNYGRAPTFESAELPGRWFMGVGLLVFQFFSGTLDSRRRTKVLNARYRWSSSVPHKLSAAVSIETHQAFQVWITFESWWIVPIESTRHCCGFDGHCFSTFQLRPVSNLIIGAIHAFRRRSSCSLWCKPQILVVSKQDEDDFKKLDEAGNLGSWQKERWYGTPYKVTRGRACE